MIKSERGRRRYIAFSVPSNIGRNDLIKEFGENGPYVVQCGSGFAIIRCAPKDVDGTIARMNAVCPGSLSLMASGTLKALRTKIPELGGKPKART